jgi:hypothetical protein
MGKRLNAIACLVGLKEIVIIVLVLCGRVAELFQLSSTAHLRRLVYKAGEKEHKSQNTISFWVTNPELI